jgi:hypothetical protein
MGMEPFKEIMTKNFPEVKKEVGFNFRNQTFLSQM